MATSYTLGFDFSPDPGVDPEEWVNITLTAQDDGLLVARYENNTQQDLVDLNNQADLDDAEFRIVETKEEAIALLEKHRQCLVDDLAELDATLAAARLSIDLDIFFDDEEDEDEDEDEEDEED